MAVGMLLAAVFFTQTTALPSGALAYVPEMPSVSRPGSPPECLHVGWSGCMIRSQENSTRKVRAYQPTNERLFRYYNNYLIPCLRAAGVEAAPLPARAVIERRLAEGYPVWLAYDRNAMVHRGEIPEDNPRTNASSFRHWLHLLLRKCPPLPPPDPN